MQDWAFVEAALGRGIRKLIGAQSVEGTILTANMQVRDKIFAMKTLLHVFTPSEDNRAACVSLMNRIGALNTHRNTVAHNMFWAHETGGVEFSITKAKGRLSFPVVIWKEEDFSNRSAEMTAVTKELETAVNRAARFRTQAMAAKGVPNLFGNALLMTNPPPSGGQGALGGLLGLGQQLLANPDSPPPSDQTEPQTPKAPRKKSEGTRKAQKK